MNTPSRQGEYVGLAHSLKTRLHYQRLKALGNDMQNSPKFKHGPSLH